MSARISHLICGFLLGVLVATAGFALFLRGRQGHPETSARTVLKLAHPVDAGHPIHASVEFFRKRLEDLSGGAVTVDIYPGGVLGNSTELTEQMQSGSLAMAVVSAAPLEEFVPEMGVFTLPYLFRDAAHYWTVLDGSIGQELLLAGEGRRLRGLCYLDAGSRSFYTRSKPILAPSDLRGMKIRVMNSRTTMRMVHEMGAAPTPISFGEVYTALQQGTVDGAENNAPTFVTSRHCEVCKHFSLDEHARIPDLLLIGVDVWRALSPDTRRWLQAAATETSGFHREAWMKKTAECLAECEAQGVTIHRPDKAPFLASVEAMLKDYAGPPLGRWIARVREAR